MGLFGTGSYEVMSTWPPRLLRSCRGGQINVKTNPHRASVTPRATPQHNQFHHYCPHSGRRIRSYCLRIASDSACFRGLPMIARPGMQFESHLGHANPLVGGFALTCVQSLGCRPSDARFAGCGLAAAVAYPGVWVAGSRPWLVGPPPAVARVLRFLVSVLSGWSGVANPCSWSREADTT